MSFFQVDKLSLRFGGLKAVDEVSFSINKGEIFTIIGPNGAGKTSIFNLISRLYEPTSGRLYFEGKDITEVAPHKIAKMGIARTIVIRALKAFVEWHKSPAAEQVRAASKDEVEKVYEAIDRLRSSPNLELRAEAERAREALGRKS